MPNKKKPVKIIDKNKALRDNALDATLEEKLMKNLQWSMTVFCFNQICDLLNEDEDIVEPGFTQKEYFKQWKKFINDSLIKEDIKNINIQLNSDINLFTAALTNQHEMIESTEIYQQKYYSILNKIENFFFNIVNEQDENN